MLKVTHQGFFLPLNLLTLLFLKPNLVALNDVASKNPFITTDVLRLEGAFTFALLTGLLLELAYLLLSDSVLSDELFYDPARFTKVIYLSPLAFLPILALLQRFSPLCENVLLLGPFDHA